MVSFKRNRYSLMEYEKKEIRQLKTERNRRLKAYRLKQFDFEFHQKAKFYLIEKGKTALSQRWKKERKKKNKTVFSGGIILE